MALTKKAPKVNFSFDTETIDNSHLILYNDDINSFEYVIDCLIKVCHHDPIQAEQCATIAHFNDKCAIKTGSFDELKPLHQQLGALNLTTSID
ncbi:MAG: ATP-dependent Clp protease adaptor ClpS [Salinivirgaceae bacterium]|nr:ATP-dependent Clp protease adaptor ClpS [Salinivirgaceae bacterium]